MKNISEVVKDMAVKNKWRISKRDQKELRWLDKWEKKLDLVVASESTCKTICREAMAAVGQDEVKMKRWVAIEYCGFPLLVHKCKEKISLYFKIKNKKNED